MDIKRFCKKYLLTEDQFFGREWVEGDLDLHEVRAVPDGFSVKVMGWLDLGPLKTLPSGVSLSSGGSMHLNFLKTLPPGVSLSSGGSMHLDSLTSLSPGVSLSSGGSLDLRSLKTLASGVSLASGGWLDLNSLKTLSPGVSLASGDLLALSSLATLPSDFGPLCRSLALPEGVDFQHFEIPNDKIFTHKNKKYIRVDRILSEVIHQRKNIYKIKIVGYEEPSYLVSDGENWAHGSTLKEARDSLAFKNAKRDLSELKNYTLNTELSFNEAISCYHSITGACEYGIKSFIQSRNIKRKSYKISEIISLTEGQYGHEVFSNFFE